MAVCAWFDQLVERWIKSCENCGIDPNAIERAQSFIDGDSYTPADKKPPALAALLAWYMEAESMDEEPPSDELMGSGLWRLMALCETAYYMGRDDATSTT